MSFFDFLALDVMILLLPLSIALILIAYFSNFNRSQKLILLDIASVTSTYIIVRYNIFFPNPILMIIVNIPLLISFFNKRLLVSIIISFILSYYYKCIFSFNIYFLFLEYFLYIVIFFLIVKKSSFYFILMLFTIIKSTILGIIIYEVYKYSIYMSVFEFVLMVLVFIVLALVTFILMKKGLSAVSINTALQNLEKEKELRTSLFKITHEVKNPLAVCKGYISMFDFSDKDKSIRYIDIIKKEIERTLDILDNFSLYTKIKIKKERMDLKELIEDTFNDLKELFSNKRIVFKKDILVSDSYIMGDYNRLKQVLINIFKNSIESIKEDGIITVSFVQNKNKYIITIVDNGCGMDKETLNRLGEIFFTTKDKGSGIGVSLSKEIIKQHDGTINYDSVLNKGTKVTLVFNKM